MSLFEEFKDIDDFKEQCGYTIDGDWYPRVTKIVGIKAKPALYYFYGEAKSYGAAKEITERSAEEGTMLHEVVEGFLLRQDGRDPGGGCCPP